MFGLSITKILFTIGIVVAVWRGWKMVDYLRDKIGDEPEQTPKKAEKGAGGFARKAKPGSWFKRPTTAPSPPPPPAVDLVPCPHCGVYVANDEMFEHARVCPKQPKA